MNIPYIYGQMIYFFLDLFPDLFKFIIMIGGTVIFIMAVFEKSKEQSNWENFVEIFWLLLGFITVGMVWKTYFNQEVDISILQWFINIPYSTLEYIITHLFIDILVIIIFVGYWVPRKS